jgi:hypothetical protein
MNARPIAVLAALFLCAAPAYANCVYPKPSPAAPNGATATREQMLESKSLLDKYQGEVNTYLACLEEDATKRIAEAGDNQELIGQIKKQLGSRHNAALDELQSRADDFNVQLRAFTKKQKE